MARKCALFAAAAAAAATALVFSFAAVVDAAEQQQQQQKTLPQLDGFVRRAKRSSSDSSPCRTDSDEMSHG